jgi:hypothetical protein
MLWSAPSAWAHAGGLSPTSVRSTVLAVSPAVAGLAVAVIEDGARLVLHNGTGAVVDVLPGGGQTAALSVPAGESRMWIDSRATTLGRDIGVAGTAPWEIPVAVGNVTTTVRGEFTAAAAPATLSWWTATFAIGVVMFSVVRWSRRPDVVVAAAGVAAVLASVTHVVGATLVVRSAPVWGTLLDATGIGLLVWPLTLAAAIAAARGNAGGVLGVCVGAGLSVVFILPDVTVFTYGVLPFAGPPTLERLIVAVVLGVGAATAAAGAAALRTLADRENPLPPTTDRI